MEIKHLTRSKLLDSRSFLIFLDFEIKHVTRSKSLDNGQIWDFDPIFAEFLPFLTLKTCFTQLNGAFVG